MTKITNPTSKASSTTTTTSTTKYDWCNLDNYDVAVQQRLDSSKDIIVVAEIDDITYEKAKSVCENICGRLYLPSTLKENDEVESVLVGHLKSYGNVWLRMTYNETVRTWYDPDNKEGLSFLNFDPCDNINSTYTREHHAMLDWMGDWWSKAGNMYHSQFVLCELT